MDKNCFIFIISSFSKRLQSYIKHLSQYVIFIYLGKVFVTAGLGGMSGAQAKAAVICGCVGVIAEVSYEALKKR